MYDSIIIGCGFAGAVCAANLADHGKKVLIIEKRDHIGGNCYDERDEHGVLIHKYGPHIFHTNNKRVYDYLSKYTEWYEYTHEVIANVYGKYIPVPFNLNTLHMAFEEEEAKRAEEKLISEYGMGARVPILTLMESEDEIIRKIADYVYENIFLKYTMKQWGQKPEEVDKSVTARVPVVISRDDRYFSDEYQGMPLEGYTVLFDKMLSNENITLKLGVDSRELISFKDNKIIYNGEVFEGDVVYTGAIDELFDNRYGRLPYRSLRFELEHHDMDEYQPKAVVNYTVSEDYTRITEYKQLTGQSISGTTIMKEYPLKYTGEDGQIPYYAIIDDENMILYNKYRELVDNIDNFHLLGRLAEYKYYNIDAIVLRALELSDHMNK